MLTRAQWDRILGQAGVQGISMPTPPLVRRKQTQPIPANYMQRIRQGIPEQTADLPIVPQPPFKEALIKERTGEEGSAWDIITKPLTFLGRALSSGEYAVASMLRSLIRQSKGIEGEDPFSALLKGFAAGFTGDQEFDYTISELIENELGWDPQDPWSLENIAQEGVGLAFGILADPLTWALSFGAKGASKFTAQSMTKVGVDSGIIPAAQKVVRGAATSKKGDKVLGNLARKYAGLAGKPGEVIEAGAKEIGAMVDAGKRAKQNFLKLILSRSGTKNLDELKQIPGWTDAATEALNVLGHKGSVTDDALKRLLSRDYKKLLDSNGIKFFGKTMVPFKLPGPLTQGAFGFLNGWALEKKVPLAYKLAGTKAMREIMKLGDKAYLGAIQGVKDMFSLTGKLGGEGAELVKNALGYRSFAEDLTQRVTAAAMGRGPKQKAFQIGQFKFTIPETSGRFLGGKEQKMLGHLLHYADEMGIEGPQLKRYLANLENSPSIKDAFYGKGRRKVFLKEFSQESREAMGEAAVYIRNLFDEIRRFDGKLTSAGGETVRDQYFSKVIKGFKETDDIERIRREFGGRLPFFEKSRRELEGKATNYQAWWNELQGKSYILEMDPRKVVAARVKPSLLRAAEEDIVQQAVNMGLATSPKINLAKKLADHPEFTRKHPLLAKAILDKTVRLQGSLTETGAAKAKRFFDTLYNKSPDEVEDWVTGEGMKVSNLPQDLSRKAAEEMKDRYNTYINTFERRARPEEFWESATTAHGQKVGTPFGTEAQEKAEKLKELQPLFEARIDSIVALNRDMEFAKTVFGKAAGSGKELREKAVLLQKINRKADELGSFGDKAVDEYIPAMAAKISGEPGKPLTQHSQATLKKIDDILTTKGSAKQREQALEYISPLIKKDEDNLIRNLSDISVKDPVTGDEVKAENLGWDRNLVEEIVDVFHPESLGSRKIKVASKLLDGVTNPLKRFLTLQQIPGVPFIPRLGFAGRNFVDLFFRSSTNLGVHNVIGGLDEWKAAYRAMLGDTGKLTIKNGGGASYEITYEAFRQWLSDTGFWRHSFAGRINTMGKRGRDLAEMDNILSLKYDNLRTGMRDLSERISKRFPKGVKALHPETLNEGMENFFLAKNAIALLNRGHTFDDVAQKLQTHLFSYNNLTRGERNIARRLIMFYPFQRQAIPFVIEQLKSRPYLFHGLQNLHQAAYATREEEASAPPWVRNFPMIRGEAEEGKFKLYSLRNIFTLDTIADLVPDQMHQVFGNLNPIITAPFELMMGRDLYFNEPIGEGLDVLGAGGARKKIKWQKISKFMKESPLADILEMQEFTYPSNGQKAITVNGAKWHILKRTYFSRFYRELNNFARMMEGDKTKTEWALRFFTGVKLYDIDIEKQMMFLEYDAEKNKRLYDRAVSRGDKKTANEVLKAAKIPDVQ